MIEKIDFVLVREIISSVLIILGVVFMLIATIGLMRFPDFYIRMSAITKGATLGLGLILTGLGIYFNQPDMLLKVVAIIFFTFLTSPVAAHVISRAAVHNKIPFWKRTDLKEFKDYLHQENLIRDNKKEEEKERS